jgi:Domain of unknown function (DUF5679)
LKSRRKETVEHIVICRILRNRAVVHFRTLPLSAKIAARNASDQKKPQIEPCYEGLYSKSAELAPRQFAVVTGYCVYEKKKNREIKNPKQIKLKNGRPAIKGTCASCGKTIFRIGKLK